MSRPGLRERKKIETLHRIQDEAMRLFGEQGYEATTIEQIAGTAGVSPSTFYRYFPTKEDVVVQDEYDPMIVACFAEQPPDRAPLKAMRGMMREMMPPILDTDADRILSRIKLIMSVPALRARQFEQSVVTERMIVGMLADRIGRDRDDVELRNFAATVVAAMTTAVLAWADGDGQGDLAEFMDRCLAHLEAGVPL